MKVIKILDVRFSEVAANGLGHNRGGWRDTNWFRVFLCPNDNLALTSLALALIHAREMWWFQCKDLQMIRWYFIHLDVWWRTTGRWEQNRWKSESWEVVATDILSSLDVSLATSRKPKSLNWIFLLENLKEIKARKKNLQIVKRIRWVRFHLAEVAAQIARVAMHDPDGVLRNSQETKQIVDSKRAKKMFLWEKSLERKRNLGKLKYEFALLKRKALESVLAEDHWSLPVISQEVLLKGTTQSVVLEDCYAENRRLGDLEFALEDQGSDTFFKGFMFLLLRQVTMNKCLLQVERVESSRRQ